MANFQSKKSVMAVKTEVTEGTPVWPTAGADFIPIQDDVSIEPAFNVLENSELTGSIGKAKPILGVQEPTSSFSLYLKHSGVEGQEPNYGALLESIFGNKEVNATEYDTVAGSTTTVINVDAGEGVNFQKGEALLIKDSSNGYNIRTIKSIATDALTLDFALPAAPASAVNLGKSILYYPANSSHPSVTLTKYGANEACIEQVAGGRLPGYSIEVTAGELVNQAFELEGTKYHYNPIEITSSNNKMDFDDGGGEENVSVSAKTYSDPHELAAALESAMNGATTDTITVSYIDGCDGDADEGKFKIETDGVTLSLLWNTGANTAETIGGKLGFSVAADDTGATAYTADSVQSYVAPASVQFDAADPLAAKNFEVFVGTQDCNECLPVNNMTISLNHVKNNVDEVCAESARAGSVLDEREPSVEMTFYVQQYDAIKFKNFRANDTVGFLFNFGTKSGGNWEAGKSGCFSISEATISSYSKTDLDGLIAINMTLSGFVSSGANEVFLNFL